MASAQNKRARVFITLGILLFLTLGTVAAIYFARGYKLELKSGKPSIKGTGLLSTTSYPKSAEVYIDNELITATDDTVNLDPGTYQVRIAKEGFLPWQKELQIEAELVTTANARLFPAAPSLSAITFTGISPVTPSSDGKKLAYVVQQADNPTKKGLYVVDITGSLLNLNRAPIQIAASTPSLNFAQANLVWSPDSTQILAAFTNPKGTITSAFLLNPNNLNNLVATPDVTVRLPLIFSTWEQELARTQTNTIKKLPEFIVGIATASAVNVYFSPDGEKMLYTAIQDLIIPENLIPPLVSINTTPQTRELKVGRLYVYDLKEDTNYDLGPALKSKYSPKRLLVPKTTPTPPPVGTPSALEAPDQYQQLQQGLTILQTIQALNTFYTPIYTLQLQWFPTSRHFIATQDAKITILEYDNINHTVVYSGPFDPDFVYPSPNDNQLFLLTNLNQPNQPLNLYSLNLK